MLLRYSYEVSCKVCGEIAWSGDFANFDSNDVLQRWHPPFGWVGVMYQSFTYYYCPKHRIFVKEGKLKEVINYDG